MKFKHTIQLRVRYGETDQMGYCYYGNYAQYFEVGRVETLRSLGLSYKQLENEGFMLPVSEFSVKYQNPALYDDLLFIETTITEVKGARVYFTYIIKNEAEKTVATATTTLVFVAKESMRPTSPPSNFIELIEKQTK